MAAESFTCRNCGNTQIIRTYSDFIVCPCCKTREVFTGFTYKEIDRLSSMYASAKFWMDCPACRSRNMYLGAEGRKWRCPDCGYTITDEEKNKTVFWFCDDCDSFLNVQEGFTDRTGTWKCTNCGFGNDVTEDNII